MTWIKFKAKDQNNFNLFLLLGFLFIIGCANDESLTGLREPVLDNEVSYVKEKSSVKLKLNKPKNWNSWNSRGRTAKHDIGNLIFDRKEKNSHFRKSIGPKGIYVEPVVSGKEIYILTPNGYVVAYSTKGKFLWEMDVNPLKRKKRNTNILGGLAIDKNNLIVTTSLGEILSVDTKNRELNWRFDFKRPFRAPPIIYKKKIYAVTGDDIALSLNINGKLRWTKKGPQKTTKLMSAAAPAASGNKIFFPFSGGSLMALNATNGLNLWSNNFESSRVGESLSTIGDFGGDPVIFGSRIYAISAFGEIFSSNLNGKVLWRNNISGRSRLIVSGNSIFFISGDNNLVRIDSRTGKLLYKTDDLKTRKRIRFIGPLLVENKLLVYSDNGYMMWFDAESGALIKEKNIGMKVSSPPILVDMKIIFVSANGMLNILN